MWEGLGQEKQFFKELSLFHYVQMHSLCIFDHAFLAHPKPFLCSFFFHPIHMDMKLDLPMKFLYHWRVVVRSKSPKIWICQICPKPKSFHFQQWGFSIFVPNLIFFTWKDPAWSHLQLWRSLISQILTFYIVFRKACIGWSFFSNGTVLGLNSGQWELKLETSLFFDGGIGTQQ